ncbi:hypothetical protein DL767_000143 [Monosporascus sp. MG133]|nr:hypothetical protein DL767_000143 [Monosporascus sp. MG133]
MFQTILSVSALAAVASAHQNFHQFWVNGESPGYQVGIRMPPSNSPVKDIQSNDIVCNVGGTKVPSGVETIAASEGDEITVGWDISSHPGPITHFLYGPVDDASQATGIGAGWFKIDELDYEDGKWANEVVMNNGGNYTFKLPTGLESGEYLLRSEMEALHGSQTVGGAEFYIGCAQLKITGTGGGCSPSISLPGAYKAEDDNIYIPNVYFGFEPSTFTAPGGPVATCGGGAGGSAPEPTSTTAAPTVSVTSEEVAEPTAPGPVASEGESSAVVPTSSPVVTPTASRPSGPAITQVVTSVVYQTSVVTLTQTECVGNQARHVVW